MIILIVILSVLVILFAYTTWNLFKKNELYERNIEEFYSSLSITLHAMRALDQKQMFETDDEVGEVFSQLVDTINSLRPLLYGIEDDGKEKD